MNIKFLRLIMVLGSLFYFSNSTAGEWEKGIKRVAIPGGLTADQLPDAQSKGAALLALYCGQCHKIPSPRMHSTSDWPMRFEKMMDHAMLMAGASPDVKTPADKEKKEIVSYLEKNGFRGLPATSLLRGEPKAFNVMWFCSACHAMPDPTQFPAKEWGKIVDRMNSYRKEQGREEMNDSDKRAVINFLVDIRMYLKGN
ncbi:MAG: hypothetical protein KGJ19_07320 [Betaproteobacteria bacterium]|nr:hypothetical protein [Betaproteobacteria bacterium]